MPTIQESVELISTLGRGHFGVVSSATYQNRKIAVKQFLNLPKDTQCLQNEIAMMQGLPKSEHLISLVETFSDGFAMELIEGENLKEYLKSDNSSCFFSRLNISLQILQGLNVLHQHEIVHADIKPANILLERTKENLRVVIGDIGLAMRAPQPIQLIKQRGTTVYMAPEMLKDSLLSYSLDLYALGILFWEMQTNGDPKNGFSSTARFMQSVLAKSRPSLSEIKFEDPAYTILICCLWRQLAEDRPTVSAALKIMETIVSEMRTAKCSYVSAIKKHAFFQTPIDAIWMAVTEKNKFLLEKLLADQKFKAAWLTATIKNNQGESLSPFLQAMRLGYVDLACQFVNHPLADEKILTLTDDHSPNGPLFTALTLGNERVMRSILVNKNFTAELFATVFIDASKSKHREKVSPNWIDIALMKSLDLKDVHDNIISTISEFLTHDYFTLTLLKSLCATGAVEQGSILSGCDFYKLYQELERVATKEHHAFAVKLLECHDLSLVGLCRALLNDPVTKELDEQGIHPLYDAYRFAKRLLRLDQIRNHSDDESLDAYIPIKVDPNLNFEISFLRR